MQDSWLGSRLKTFSISALNSFSTPGEVNKQERMFCHLHLKRFSRILVAKSGECTRSQIRRNAKAPSYPLPIANWIIKHFFSAIAVFQFSLPISLIIWLGADLQRVYSGQTHSKKTRKNVSGLASLMIQLLRNSEFKFFPRDHLDRGDAGKNGTVTQKVISFSGRINCPARQFEFSRHFFLSSEWNSRIPTINCGMSQRLESMLAIIEEQNENEIPDWNEPYLLFWPRVSQRFILRAKLFLGKNKKAKQIRMCCHKTDQKFWGPLLGNRARSEFSPVAFPSSENCQHQI